MLDVTMLPILDDNYTFIIKSNDKVAIIDPGEAEPVIEYLDNQKLKPNFIFNTHHHWDHTNGNNKIKNKYDCSLIAPEKEHEKIKNIDIALSYDDTFVFGDETIKIIEATGHTMGHICYYFKNSKILFSGDALFSMGCGRLFEGSASDLYEGFQKIKKLPHDTIIYCGHEYTKTNAEFCLKINPSNTALQKRYEEVINLREKKISTLPTTLKQELETNCFLRAENVEDLQNLRNLKDEN